MNHALLLLSLALLLGCSGQNASVTGMVTLDGQPLDRGAVSFHAIGSGPTAVGQIDTTGRYTLKIGEDAGLPPGEYVVTVVASEDPLPPKGFDSPTPGELITPARYGSMQTTDIRKCVVAGDNQIDLALVRP